jgi:hypothetical protein
MLLLILQNAMGLLDTLLDLALLKPIELGTSTSINVIPFDKK